jgi:hypothetical protein
VQIDHMTATKNGVTSKHFQAWERRSKLDLSRFDAAPLIAFTATKETDYGTETDERIPQGCGAYRADQRADTQTGG